MKAKIAYPKAHALMEKNHGYFPMQYTAKFIAYFIKEGYNGTGMFFKEYDDDTEEVDLEDILIGVYNHKLDMCVDLSGCPEEQSDTYYVTFCSNDNPVCGGFIQDWDWDKNKPL